MTPEAFKKICKDAENVYLCIHNAICSDRMSNDHKHLTSIHTMVIMYITICSQSQKVNSFQLVLPRTLQKFGISKQGLESLRNLGITAHPESIKIKSKSCSSSHPNEITSFINSAIQNNFLFNILHTR